jgi:hypothetical protein
MNPFLVAELVVRASLKKEAIGRFDKAVLKYVVAPPVVAGGALYGLSKVPGGTVERHVKKHQERMRRIRATYDPTTGRMI